MKVGDSQLQCRPVCAPRVVSLASWPVPHLVVSTGLLAYGVESCGWTSHVPKVGM
jgi:hypothetical protein